MPMEEFIFTESRRCERINIQIQWFLSEANVHKEDLDSFLVIAVLNFYGLNCVIHWFESIIAKENFLIFVKEVVNKRLDLTLGNSKSYGIFSRQICRNDFEELENLGKFSYLASPCQNRNFFPYKSLSWLMCWLLTILFGRTL